MDFQVFLLPKYYLYLVKVWILCNILWNTSTIYLLPKSFSTLMRQFHIHSLEGSGLFWLRFYVKSILKNLEVLKLSFLPFWDSEFRKFGKFQCSKTAKNHKKSKFRASKCGNSSDFDSIDSPTLISRKFDWQKKSVISTLWHHSTKPGDQIPFWRVCVTQKYNTQLLSQYGKKA